MKPVIAIRTFAITVSLACAVMGVHLLELQEITRHQLARFEKDFRK